MWQFAIGSKASIALVIVVRLIDACLGALGMVNLIHRGHSVNVLCGVFLEQALGAADARRVLLPREHIHCKVILLLEPRYFQLV